MSARTPSDSLFGPLAALLVVTAATVVGVAAFLRSRVDAGRVAPASAVLVDLPRTQEEELGETRFNDVIGMGGGAGGKFGGRFGGRRNIRGAGGKGRGLVASRETYAQLAENTWRPTAADRLSTFAVDVDTASFTNVRRFLERGKLPPPEAVRVEELVNAFRYDDPAPRDYAEPLSASVEIASCPWNREHRLARVALKSAVVPPAYRQPSNLVFLIDVSGSMKAADKLPLVKQSLRLLVENLSGRDRVAIVVYAGAAGLVLPSTVCTDPAPVLAALERLAAGGSTAGGAGIRLAYEVAAAHRIPGGVNRVVLATDGDFNVGTTDEDELVALVRERSGRGIHLTVLGFGTGNLHDSRLETLADDADGHYAYVDRLAEAERIFVEELSSTLVTVAQDVKLQIEFDPALVGAHRLVGYENRVLAHEEFDDDAKDAGEVGAGHGVTALYELIPTDAWRVHSAERPILRVRLRWKDPGGTRSRLRWYDFHDRGAVLEEASDDLRFSAAVAAFGMVLRRSPYRGNASLDSARALAEGALGLDRDGRRAEFLELVDRARELAPEH